MAKAKTPAKIGRPSKYTDAIATEICERVAGGESLIGICASAASPDKRTVLRWLDDPEHDGFATKYARAREAQGDFMDERILAVADACTPETASADRVKIDAYKWRASKLAPKRYGDRTVHAGDDSAPILTVTRIERIIVRPGR